MCVALKQRSPVSFLNFSSMNVSPLTLSSMTTQTAPQQESKRYSSFIRKGIYERRRNGGSSGIVPLGYKIIREGCESHLAVDEASAHFVRLLFSKACDAERSLGSVYREMTELGMRSQNGNILNPSSFSVILSNPYYAGFVKTEDGQLVIGKHEEIVMVKIFNQVQERLGRKAVAGTISRDA